MAWFTPTGEDGFHKIPVEKKSVRVAGFGENPGERGVLLQSSTLLWSETIPETRKDRLGLKAEIRELHLGEAEWNLNCDNFSEMKLVEFTFLHQLSLSAAFGAGQSKCCGVNSEWIRIQNWMEFQSEEKEWRKSC